MRRVLANTVITSFTFRCIIFAHQLMHGSKYMESQSLIKELEELRVMVNQSSEHTQRQLQNIDNNLLIGTFN